MLFRDSAAAVAAECLSGSLFLRLTDQFVHMHGHKPSAAEARSWERSIPVLANAMNDAGLGQVEMLLEYGLPLNSKRADALLAGVHPETGLPSYVVVELKQWSSAEPDDDDLSLCHVDAYARPVLNPVDQVRGYCQYLISFNGALAEHPERVSGAAYLHNATEFGLNGLFEAEQDAYGQLFIGARRGEFIDFLRTKLGSDSGATAADELLAGKVGPSKQLMAVAAQEVREREQFVLLDEQKVAYRMVLNAVRRAKHSDHKEVLVVTGGPGTGKSVIALSLLGELYRQGITALHATGSSSFTTTMRKVAGARKREVQDLFKYFNSFMTAERNSLDVLICDEAHRMRETSANRYTPHGQIAPANRRSRNSSTPRGYPCSCSTSTKSCGPARWGPSPKSRRQQRTRGSSAMWFRWTVSSGAAAVTRICAGWSGCSASKKAGLSSGIPTTRCSS